MIDLTLADPAFLGAAGGSPLGPIPLPSGTVAHWHAESLLGSVADGGPVGAWVDDVNGLTVSASGTARPVLDVDAAGGRPTLVFDGVNDALVLAGTAPVVSNASLGSVIVVAGATTSDATMKWFWSSSQFSSSIRYMGGAAYSSQLRMQSHNAGAGGADVVYAAPPTGLTLFEWYGGSSAGSWQIRYNNTAQSLTVAAVANAGRWFSGVSPRDRFAIGGCAYGNTVQQFFNGTIARVLVVDGAMSSGERAALYAWLAAYYGVSVA